MVREQYFTNQWLDMIVKGSSVNNFPIRLTTMSRSRPFILKAHEYEASTLVKLQLFIKNGDKN